MIILKGEFEAKENPLNVAIREEAEATEVNVSGNFIELTLVTKGKLIFPWKMEG